MSTDVETPTVAQVTGTGLPIRGNDIDTDQILPGRFLKAITFDGLGEFAFFDQRYGEDDTPTDHPMNRPQYQEATVMVVNANFGCGSSREHAPQALKRWGIDAIVGESFADIFAGNCLSLGLPAVTASTDRIASLQNWVEENPDGKIELDLQGESVVYGGTTIDIDIKEGRRRALVDGRWDTTALMRSNEEAIAATAAELPYVGDEGHSN